MRVLTNRGKKDRDAGMPCPETCSICWEDVPEQLALDLKDDIGEDRGVEKSKPVPYDTYLQAIKEYEQLGYDAGICVAQNEVRRLTLENSELKGKIAYYESGAALSK